MKHDIEEDRGFFHFEEGLKENEMPGAANGQKLRYPLNDTEKDSLEETNFKAPLSPLVTPRGAGFSVEFEIRLPASRQGFRASKFA
jgi:hypothetical protein